MKKRTNPVVAAAALAAVSLSATPAARAATQDAVPDEDGVAPTTSTTAAPSPVTTSAPTTSTTQPPTTSTSSPTTSTSSPTTSTSSPTTSTSSPTTTSTSTGETTTTLVPESTIPASTVPPSTLPPAPAALGVQVPIGGDYAAILMTIRTLESGNRYGIPKNRGGASGAYQFIDRTWGNFGGYPSAYLAPPAVQDQKALADVQRFLAQWGGDVSMVPVMWYYPKAAYNPALMDQVPMPGAGNSLTIREYQYKWMRLYQRFSGNVVDLSLYQPQAVLDRVGTPPTVIGGVGTLEQVAYPVLGPSTISAPAACDGPDCEPGSDAIIGGTRLQPVLTAFEGVVTDVEPGDAVTGEVSVTVTDRIGRTYTYSGFNSASSEDGNVNAALSLSSNARVGVTVRAGTVLGFMGNTDPSDITADETDGEETDAAEASPDSAHIRLTIRDQQGDRLDAVRLVTEAQAREACRVGIGPWSLSANPSIGNDPNYPTFEPIRVELGDNGSFKIEPDGTVNAIGEAALIVPDVGCEWSPELPFGPGVGGQTMPDNLREPIRLPLSLLIAGADDASVGPFGIG